MKKTIVMLLLILTTVRALAGNESVHDVFTGKEWKLQTFYEEKFMFQLNENIETTLQWFAFADSAQPGFKILNRNIKKLVQTDWLMDPMYAKLTAELKKRRERLNTIYHSGSTNNYGYSVEDNDPYPKINDVELRAISVVQNTIWFEIVFSMMKINAQQTDLKLRYYYKGDLNSGSVIRVENPARKADHDALARLLAPLFTRQYILRTGKLSESEKRQQEKRWDDEPNEEEQEKRMEEGEADEEEQEEEQERIRINTTDSASICADLCVHIDFSEMDVYCFGWGLIVGFQEGTATSRIYDGEGFSLFLEGGEQKALATLLQRIDLLPIVSTEKQQIFNFDHSTLSEEFSALRKAPDVFDLIEKNNAKVRSLEIKSYQVFENERKNYRGRYVAIFDLSGKLTWKYFINERGDTLQNTRFAYDKEGRLAQTWGTGYDQQFERTLNRYDPSGNLVYREDLEDDEINCSYYFYNGSRIYSTQFNNLILSDQGVGLMLLSDKEVCYSTACYKIDQQWRPLAQTRRKYASEEIQIARDEKGRLNEVHAENDRYNYYFDYDAQQRFRKFSAYEFQRPLLELRYLYEGDAPLPYEQIKVTLSSGQRISELEEYLWEYQ